ncbi:MAG: 2,3-bisphosphoglycerate-independent phosphoglycerate mutase [Bacteroidales bacterium]|nr:2,3-bisphosphoglycerate-independent phosphoglycerate mutase [Bacteroidales bacterium]
MKSNKVILTILDGWGIGDGSKSDAISSGNTPNIDQLMSKYPHAELLTSGENVGLPDGQMGNSEVGHLNIGSGRKVYQDLVRINRAIADKSIEQHAPILKAIQIAKDNRVKLHLIGLVSDGGVHSSQDHLHKLCDIATQQGLDKVFVHAITDGRDTDPKSGIGFLSRLEEYLQTQTAEIASIVGRYYAMDRDKRWDRIKIVYDLYTQGTGKKSNNLLDSVKTSYAENVTDEFLKPIINAKVNGTIEADDVVICFNFRTDRLRQLTTVLTQKDMPEFGMHTLPLHYFTMTNYDDTFKNVEVIYNKDNLKLTLGEVVSNYGLKQLRIAETEKYAHVTFFFSGGREAVFEGEERILVSSPKVATYDLQPEMSAYEVRDKLIDAINSEKYDLIVVNFANGDMVGHTGVYEAILKAVETIDTCVGDVSKAAQTNNYHMIVIADHGNSDHAINKDNTPNTAHSLNPVPIILISEDYHKINSGVLADVAPTILKLMNIPQPDLMSGQSLI